jgi:AcrR family transcriptional regulator
VEILDRALDMLTERMEAVLALPLPPEEKLRQAMITYMDGMTSHFDLASVLLLEHRSLDPEYQSRHIPKRDHFESLWRDLIQDGKTKGVFNSTDSTFAARALLGVMNWTITWYHPDGPLTSEEIAHKYADLFLNGLLVRHEDES